MATTWRGFGNFASRELTRRHGSKFPLGDSAMLLDDGEARRIAGELLGQGVKAEFAGRVEQFVEDMQDLQ